MFDTLVHPAGHGGVGLAFTDRLGGVSASDIGPLNLGRTDADDVESVARNFDLVAEAIGVGTIIAASQVHGTDVVLVDERVRDGWAARGHLGTPAGAPPLPVADAMVSRLTGVALCIRVADCMPVLFADAEHGVIGAAHAGREGLLAGVLPATVSAMRDLGATQVEAWLGPHVCGDCYEVPAAMAEAATERLPAVAATTRWATPAIDLAAGASAQLAEVGVQLHRHDPCTLEHQHLHSHRRDGARSGRLAGIIWRVSDAG